MALIDCDGCGRGVSDRAAACPNCGHPRMAVAYGSAVVTKNSHPILTFLGGAVVVVFVLAAIGAAMESRESAASSGAAKPVAARPPAPAARFVAADVVMDENCTQLGEYCVSVHCTYQNVGDGPGARRVLAELLTESGERVAIHHSTLTLMPGATQRVTFNFMEATLEGDGYRARCEVGEAGSAPGSAA